MQHENWQCGKCGGREFEVDEFRATGGIVSKIFDVQSKRFTTVSCERCAYTEIYRTRSSTLGSVLDFLTQ